MLKSQYKLTKNSSYAKLRVLKFSSEVNSEVNYEKRKKARIKGEKSN